MSLESYSPSEEEINEAGRLNMDYIQQAQSERRESALGPEKMSDEDLELLKTIDLHFTPTGFSGIINGQKVTIETTGTTFSERQYSGTMNDQVLTPNEAVEIYNRFIKFQEVESMDPEVKKRYEKLVNERAEELKKAEALKAVLGR